MPELSSLPAAWAAPPPAATPRLPFRVAVSAPGAIVAAPGEVVLGRIGFSATPPALDAGEMPTLQAALAALGGGDPIETWLAPGPVVYGEAEGIRYACSDELLFGVATEPHERLAAATRELYLRLVRLARSLGFPALLRLWNFFPAINEESGGLERYRQFCIGRHQALAECGYRFAEDLPAASAIGSARGPLAVVMVAARRPGLQIENPRQLSAYRYPRRYGPRSPSFSRAMLLRQGDGGCLFISGTASILGHASVAAGDVRRQLRHTVDNLQALLRQIGQAAPAGLGNRALWRVYLRHVEDYPRIAPSLPVLLGEEAPILVLQGDICRSDLALEIEGLVQIDSLPPDLRTPPVARLNPT